jgi:hypothetical protein
MTPGTTGIPLYAQVYKDCTSSIPRGRAVTHLKAQADDRQQEQQKEDSYNGASKEPGPNFDQVR